MELWFKEKRRIFCQLHYCRRFSAVCRNCSNRASRVVGLTRNGNHPLPGIVQGADHHISYIYILFLELVARWRFLQKHPGTWIFYMSAFNSNRLRITKLAPDRVEFRFWANISKYDHYFYSKISLALADRPQSLGSTVMITHEQSMSRGI